MLHRHPNPNNRRNINPASSNLLNRLLSKSNLVQLLTIQTHKALSFPGKSLCSELEVNVEVGGNSPITLQNTLFKRLDVRLNPERLLSRCPRLNRPCDENLVIEVAEQLTYSCVRLWAGYYLYCPCDELCHSYLCQTALDVIDEMQDLEISASEHQTLAQLVVSFFEKSLVSYILSANEGSRFAKGIVYDHIINFHQDTLLSNLFFASQSLAAPAVWEPELRQISMSDDPLIPLLLEDVLKIVFGLHIVHSGYLTDLVRGALPQYSDWPDRVTELTKLLVPYMTDDAKTQEPALSPPSCQGGQGGQSQDISPILTALLQEMNNPFVTAGGDDSQNPKQVPQPGGTKAGRGSPPIRPQDTQALDCYYSNHAKGIAVETQDSNKGKQKRPENEPIGYLDSEPASPTALLSEQIDLYKTRVRSVEGSDELILYKRTLPLEIPIGGKEPAAVGAPNLLLIVDSSSSMGFNPQVLQPDKRGKYDTVLRACYGIFKYIEDLEDGEEFPDDIHVACINFSGKSIESGWHAFKDIEKVKNTLLIYQHGGTTLSPIAVRKAFQTRPGKFLAIIVTDGEVGNTAQVVPELEKVAQSDCDLALLHIGKPTQFTRALKEIGCIVRILKNAKDLIGLSLEIAREKFKYSNVKLI